MRHILLTLAAATLGGLTLSACTGSEHEHAGEGIEISNARINPLRILSSLNGSLVPSRLIMRGITNSAVSKVV